MKRLYKVLEFFFLSTCRNSATKFEVSISTHYEDMKGDTKCQNGKLQLK